MSFSKFSTLQSMSKIETYFRIKDHSKIRNEFRTV